ncbi:MAG: hypothetical protein ISR76_02080 [Planctomycetes bacterium]|nr:hypothetical protein [Planctomycetota bacterium]MBL7007760.1 hypothetical protein [Planctomycetota bacterium]
MTRLLALFGLILLNSCWVNSIQPFYADAEAESVVLEGLEGLWLGQEREKPDDPGDQVCFEFRRRPDGPGYRMAVFEKDALSLVLVAHVLQVDDRLFLDTFLEDFEDPHPDLELSSLFMPHILPVHLAWSIERSEGGFTLGILASDDARSSIESVSQERIPRAGAADDGQYDPLVLTGPAASGREFLRGYRGETGWLKLRPIAELPDAYKTPGSDG